MDKYEYKASIGEINRLIEARQFAEAAEIADMIDWSKVRSVRTLCRISDLYKINRRYEDSRDILRLARERSPENRQILFSMCELELKLNNYMLALASYNKYVDLYPNDTERFILQYKIIKAHGGGYQDQIAVLEELTSRDYRERWAYELARIYYLAEEDYLCIQECEGIYAFYGYGPYVRKALELKEKLVELTSEEKQRLEYIRAGGKEPDPFYEDLSGEEGGAIKAPAGAEAPGKEGSAEKKVASPESMDFGDLLSRDVTLGDLMDGKEGSGEKKQETGSGEGRRFTLSAAEPKEADHGINVPALDQGIFSEEYMQKTIAQGLRELNLTGEKKSPESPGRELPAEEKKEDVSPGGDTREIPPIGRGSGLEKAKEKKDPEGEEEAAGAAVPEPEEDVRTDRPRRTIRYSEMFATEAEREALRKLNAPREEKAQDAAPSDREASTARLERDEIMNEWKRIQKESAGGGAGSSRGRILETAGPAVRHSYSRQTRRRDAQTGGQGATRPWNAEEVREAVRKSREAGDLPGSFVVASESDTASIDLSQYTSSIPSGGDTQRLPGGRVFMPHVGSDGETDTRSQEEVALEDMNLDSYTGNVIITGDEGSGTLKKAREMISRFREIDQTLVGKIAKTTGRQATPAALRDAVPKLEYGAMIIEHASGMSSDGIAALLELLTGEEHKIIVFLVDKKTYMDALLHDYRKLRRAFTARIDIAALSMDVLLHYAEEYALSQERRIDDSGMDALSYRLEHMQTGDHNVTLEEVRALVDEAVYYADAKTPANFLRRMTRRRYDAGGMVILRDNDFLHE